MPGCVVTTSACPTPRRRFPRSVPSVGRRRLVLALLLELVRLLLGLVLRLVGVLGRAVDGVEHQRVDPVVAEVVFLAGRDGDEITLRRVLLLPADDSLRRP